MWSEYRCNLIWTSCMHTNPILKDSLGTFYKRMLVARYMYFVQGLTLWAVCSSYVINGTCGCIHLHAHISPFFQASSTLLICYPEVNGFFPSEGQN